MALRVQATRPDWTGDGSPPAPVDGSGVVLNHAVLLGEILGLDAAAALEAINDVHALDANGLPAIYADDDQDVMIAFLEPLLAALATAVDAEGRASDTPAGRALAASEHLNPDDAGQLTVISHSMPVSDLRDAIAGVLENFSYARRHRMLVRTN